jgi:hypothetical protein
MTGTPAGDKAVGMPIFEYFEKNPDYSKIFNDAMTALSAPVAGAAIDAYDFSGIGTLVDVAGGHGEVLMSVLKACPNVRGILADLDHVVDGAKPRIAAAGLSDRMQAVVCDFFEAVPEGGDAYVMKHIIHDWDDERALLILNNIAKAMGAKKAGLRQVPRHRDAAAARRQRAHCRRVPRALRSRRFPPDEGRAHEVAAVSGGSRARVTFPPRLIHNGAL